MVDPGLTPGFTRDFLAAVATVTDKPVRYAVLTHWHPDHALGITCVEEPQIAIIAHPRTRRSLAERGAQAAAGLAANAPDARERADFEACSVRLADVIVPERHLLDLGGHSVEVFHPGAGAAHTSGDLVVWSRDERVLVTGDVFMHEASPFMGEANPRIWADVLDRLVALDPVAVVAGHFGPSDPSDLTRFRDYMRSLVTQVDEALARGVSAESIPEVVRFPEFRDFAQYPQFNATFEGNIRDVMRAFANQPAPRGELAGFHVVATLDVGRNPHQISFSDDGAIAYVAAAGSDTVTLIDVESLAVIDALAVAGTPLGVLPLPGGTEVAATRFGGDGIARYDVADGRETGVVGSGAGASLFAPLPDGRYLVSVEQIDRLWVFDPGSFSLEHAYATGDRPFPPAATSDGRLAFVPSYNDGSVEVIDLWNQRILDTVAVGDRPSGGAVLPGDMEYAVAVRGENEIAFINTASHLVTGTLTDGIGESPFSVVVSVDGRVAFVNNTASHDVSVIALPERRVVARIPVGEIPIVMGVHPSGETLWVSSEGSHELTVISIPERWRVNPSAADNEDEVTEVAVMGMIHGRHPASELWGIEQVKETIRSFAPDVVCAEIAPDRWERVWSDFTERNVIEDPRVLRFPEYVDAILELSVQMGFEIVPCAGWTQEMSDLRQARIAQFNTEPAFAAQRDAYARRLAGVRARYGEPIAANEDPRYIHSRVYDERTCEELSLYDEYQNDLIGPGGWTNINEAHLQLIGRAITHHRGERVLITFGAGHKYWLLDRLRGRDDVRVMDLRPFLPPVH